MKIIYSFNKVGFEADYWQREIAAASNEFCEFIPFNHNDYLNPVLYSRAQLLDNLYYEKHPGLLRMYADVTSLIARTRADALIVDNCFPYHPEFLKGLDIYKVLRTTDGPLKAYDRDFAYLHAYDHVLFHSPAYSRDLTMAEKLKYCGAKRFDFLPLGSFSALRDSSLSAEMVSSVQRDIDIIFIGAFHLNKMPMLAKIKKAFGRRFKAYGLINLKKNVYFNLKYGFPGWIRPVPFEMYVPLYKRSKIGINIHNRGDYTVGSYRLFDLPANRVLQLSDGGVYLESFFKIGYEIDAYNSCDELIQKIDFYLSNESEREKIAVAGYKRTIAEYSIGVLLKKAAEIIYSGIAGSQKHNGL